MWHFIMLECSHALGIWEDNSDKLEGESTHLIRHMKLPRAVEVEDCVERTRMPLIITISNLMQNYTKDLLINCRDDAQDNGHV